MLLDNFRTIISTRNNPELYSLSIPGLEASLTNGGVFVLVNLPKLLTFFTIKVSLNFKLHPLSVLRAQATYSFIFRHAIFRHAL